MAVFCYRQDDINTDLLFPGTYAYTCSTGPEIREHLLEDLDPDFASKVGHGDVIVAGSNFGCGSRREHAALGLRHVGLKAILARSFARVFYRNSMNLGLLLIQSPEAVDAYAEGDQVSIDPARGVVTVGSGEYTFPPLPREMLEIVEAGGLLAHIKAGRTEDGGE